MTDPKTLAHLNREFYDSFALEFSRSRVALNDGIVRVLPALDLSAVLDVGCGDGRVSKAVPETCRYVGLDFSPRLIGRAARGGAAFALADVAASLPVAAGSFPSVVCFAVIHHLTEREGLMRELARVVRPGGRVVVSAWQITHSARMRKKIVQDLGNGDFLLSWERGSKGLRFVHEVSEAELIGLAERAGLKVMEIFRADGRSGDLGLYGVFEK